MDRVECWESEGWKRCSYLSVWLRSGGREEDKKLNCWAAGWIISGCLSYTNEDMINDREVNISQMHKPLMKLVVVAR